MGDPALDILDDLSGEADTTLEDVAEAVKGVETEVAAARQAIPSSLPLWIAVALIAAHVLRHW